MQNDDFQQEYAQNDDVQNVVSHAQPDGIQVQESLRRSMRVSKAPSKFVDYVMLSMLVSLRVTMKPYLFTIMLNGNKQCKMSWIVSIRMELGI